MKKFHDLLDNAKCHEQGLYLMSLSLSNLQTAQELDLNKNDTQKMTQQLRKIVCSKRPDSEVECDEVYVVAGHYYSGYFGLHG